MNNSNNFLIFSHEQDVDGLFSAAVLKMVYPQSEVILTNYGFQNMMAVKNKILSFTQSHNLGTIIISDIGINYESYLPVYEALSTSKQRGFSNIWIDHHVWPEGMEEKNVPPSFVSNGLHLPAPMQRLLAVLRIEQIFQSLSSSHCLL